MKKSLLFLLLLIGGTTIASAQALRKTEKIKADQVPLSIRSSFEKDFGQVPDGGEWLAHFTVEKDGARTVAKPLSYIYRNKAQKIEVRYSAEGKLDFVKGVEKNTTPNSNS